MERAPEAPQAALGRRKGRNWTKADVVAQSLDGRLVAIKDYAPRSWLVRHTLGRWLVRREAAAFAAVRGVAGVPALVGRRGPFALATEWVEARPLATLRPEEIPAACFDDLARLLDRIHDRGVALGDLHHRDVLVDARGGIHVVDFATALVLGPRPGPLRRALFSRLRELDRLALERMRARAAGLDPEAAAAQAAPRAALWHRRGRRLKRAWDHVRRRWRVALTLALVAGLVAFAEPTAASIRAGVPLLAAGEALRLWAAGHLRKTTELVTAGPYRWLRHPLYLGRLLIFSGLCVTATLPHGASWIVLALGYAVFFGYYLPRKERVEPARLAAVHGDAYRSYHAAVPALFPAARPWPCPAGAVWSRERLLRNREHWMAVGLAALALFLAWRAYG